MADTQQTVLAGRYRLVDQLGRGGMGAVWRAHDELLGRDVAVKEVLLPPGVDDDTRDDLLERTKREARAAARLNHPNVVTVFDVVESGGRPWIVMELVEARGLNQIVRDEGPLPPERVASIGVQLLNALGVAHASGIFHRDVKPSNVLVAESGRVVLADFGIASVQGDPAMTRSGLILGSPSYIAPERARGLQAGPASDLWAVGATLYTAVEGRPPYDRDGIVPILTAAAMEDPDPYQLAGPLAPILTALLQREPEKRPDIDEARLTLRQIALLGPPTAPERTKQGNKKTAIMPRPEISAPASRSAPEAGEQPVSGAPAASVSSPPVSSPPASSPPVSSPPASSPPVSSPPASDLPVSSPPVSPAAPVAEPAGAAAAQSAFAAAPISPVAGQAAVDAPVSPASKQPRRASVPMQPSGAPPTTYNPRRNRNYAVIAAVLAAVVLIAIAGVALLNRADDKDDNTAATPANSTSATPRTSASTTPKATSQAPAGPASPSAQAPSNAPTASATTAIGTTPAGWHTYTGPGGFRIAVPDGWNVQTSGTDVKIQNFKGLFLLIQQSRTPKADAKADWLDQEQQRLRAGDFPGYQRISIQTVSYRNYRTAADWEFLFNKNGTRQHVLNRGFVTSPSQAYGFYWQTDASQWAAGQAFFQNFANTFQPAS